MNTKFTNLNQNIILWLSALTPSWCVERFLRYDQICVEKLPLVKIRKNKPKSEISLSQLLNIYDIYL